jgi:hypothetical protein
VIDYSRCGMASRHRAWVELVTSSPMPRVEAYQLQ